MIKFGEEFGKCRCLRSLIWLFHQVLKDFSAISLRIAHVLVALLQLKILTMYYKIARTLGKSVGGNGRSKRCQTVSHDSLVDMMILKQYCDIVVKYLSSEGRCGSPVH
ncbi:hypothetical protein CR513_53079, partial [Mucuna pruriens]